MLHWYYKKKAEPVDSFQLENLFTTGVPFTLVDLESSKSPTPDYLTVIKPNIQKISFNELLKEHQQIFPNQDSPVVIVCEKGKVSCKASFKLTQLGYKNCYYLMGGKALLNKN